MSKFTADTADVMDRIGVSSNPKLPKADLTNQPYLFGDAFDEGDVDDYGDLYEEGDLFEGDIDEDGDPMDIYLATAGDPMSRRQKMILAGAAGAVGGFAAARIAKAVRNKRLARARANKALNSARSKNTLRRQRSVINNVPKAVRTSSMKFTYLSGGNLTQAPLVPGAAFVTDTLKYMLDKASVETPFYQFQAFGTYTSPNWNVSLAPTTGSYYYPAFILNIGSATLTASPGTIVTCEITNAVLLDGTTLVTAGNGWIFTYRTGFDSRLVVFLWKLVANKPMPTLGVLSATNTLDLTIGGIPSQSAVTVTVPGSQHPWTLALRNSLV